MAPSVVAIILGAAFVTAVISGVFGMAGGLILMGVLATFTPVATAMVMHGFIQIISNGSRAAFLWRHVSWRILGRYAVGVVVAAIIIAALSWRPSRPVVFLLLGLTGMLVWIPKRHLSLDVAHRFQAELCGLLVQLVNTLAGVAGPLLDLFFAKTDMPRQAVVATKAATQVLAHAMKIGFWGLPLLEMVRSPEANGDAGLPPIWVFAAVIPLSLAGTWAGGRVLDRMTDASFREWTKWLITFVAIIYLARAFTAFIA
jgi:uncharacterized membrane protein YfcA